MKYDILLKQQAMIDHDLNVTQFAILDLIAAASTWADCIIINNEAYYWASRTMIVDELKSLDLKPDTVYRNLKQLVRKGLIDFRKKGKQDCVRLTPKAKAIFRKSGQKERENPYVGKKSENGEITMSEKKPQKLGKKSEKYAEKNPTDQYTNPHPLTNDPSSSSSPPIEEEKNEVVICEIFKTIEPYANLPDTVDGLPRSIIIEEVEAIANERGGDFESYRDSLIREVLSGKGRTIANIRTRITRVNLASEKPWVIANRLKRQQGEELSAALRASGHDNIFDYLEDMEHGRANESV
ncbi:hypothetical protein [Sulfuricurvum sp.]|uniref:hypothetical protein n=1 Tax=Sulfuricurvum sp. TaxID=2025608 RepID=UPI0026196C6C|nr:hypothetical protein [Sulfuricurvum sp.]MDD3597884.1 hypothetical protein [Sulfuricurvum sp.]